VRFLLHALAAAMQRAAAAPPHHRSSKSHRHSKGLPVQGEWRERSKATQARFSLSDVTFRQIITKAIRQKGSALLRSIPVPFKPCLTNQRTAAQPAQMANAELNVKRDIPEAKLTPFPEPLDSDTDRSVGKQQLSRQASVEQPS